MSRTTEDEAGSGGEGYAGAHRNLNLMMRTGRSFSGRERNRLFLNLEGRGFAEVAAVAGTDMTDDARAVARWDQDGDGDEDLVVSNRGAPVLRLLRNEQDTKPALTLTLTGNGIDTNIDAVGARVAISNARVGTPDTGLPFSKAVRAGEGFLAQSSRRLVFPVPDAGGPWTAVVAWPNGDRESFDGLQVGEHYQLSQGSGEATRFAPRHGGRFPPSAHTSDATVAAAGHGATALLDDSIIARLAFGVPAPPLPYISAEGQGVSLATRRERPLWILFWASWCTPCLEEIAEVSTRAGEIEAAGLDVLALSVEGLGDAPADPAATEAALRRSAFPFATGRASGPMMGTFQSVHDLQMTLDQSLPVPSGVLLDGKGRIRTFFRGRAGLDAILSESARIRTVDDDSPTPGNGDTSGRLVKVAPVRDTMARRVLGARRATAQALATAWAGRYADIAIEFLREISADAPEDSRTFALLGDTLAAKRRFADAERALTKSTELFSEHAGVWNNLGSVRASRGDLAGAVAAYERALEIAPALEDARANLSRARALLDRSE